MQDGLKETELCYGLAYCKLQMDIMQDGLKVTELCYGLAYCNSQIIQLNKSNYPVLAFSKLSTNHCTMYFKRS
jgi:hypothetical protein